jgi:NADH-quinone oxidoreductase subunit C
MKEAIDKLIEKFGDAVLETSNFRGDETCVVGRENLVEVCRFLKDDKKLKFEMLTDLCGADYKGRECRFEVVYHLYSVDFGKRIRIKVRLNENDAVVPSVSGIWKAANWFEREAFDLFGIRFEGHPNLKRLLTFEGFEGHALRKDYPKNKRQRIPTPDPLV